MDSKYTETAEAIIDHTVIRRQVSSIGATHITPGEAPLEMDEKARHEYKEARKGCLENDAILFTVLESLEDREVRGCLRDGQDVLLDMLLKMFYESDYDAYPDMWYIFVHLQAQRDVLTTILDEAYCKNSEQASRVVKAELTDTIMQISRLMEVYIFIHPRLITSQISSRRLQVSRCLLDDLSSSATTLPSHLMRLKRDLSYYLTKASERRRDLWLMSFEIRYSLCKHVLHSVQASDKSRPASRTGSTVKNGEIDEIVKAVDRARDRVHLQEMESEAASHNISCKCEREDGSQVCECPVCLNPLPPASSHVGSCPLSSLEMCSASLAFSRVELGCKHFICGECLVQHAATKDKPQCPLCREEIDTTTLNPFKYLIDLSREERSKMDETVASIAEYARVIISYYITLHPISPFISITLPVSIVTAINDMVRRALLSKTFTEYNFMEHLVPKAAFFNSIIELARSHMKEVADHLGFNLESNAVYVKL